MNILHYVFVLLILGANPVIALGASPCRIEVVDRESKWPVPLIELRTVSGHRLVSDNAGLIACDLPECYGVETWFEIIGHGYGVPTDGFGQRGVRLTPQQGITLRVEVDRQCIARRMGRITGSGLFAEGEKLGLNAPVSPSGIVGCDSVQNAIHEDKLFWVWGDTNLPKYPLGIFQSTGATTVKQPLRSLAPPLVMPLDGFTDDLDKPRGIADVPGAGPTWLSALASLQDAKGKSHLVATYAKIKPPLDVWQRGLVEWNEATKQFEVLKVLWDQDAKSSPRLQHFPDGHAAFWTDPDQGGKRYVLFGNPLPVLKVPATYEAWQDPAQWISLSPQTKLDVATLDDKANSFDKKPIEPHTGSIAWNAYRQRWVTVFMQRNGTPSVFGEIWYAESHLPAGPWGPAVKILSHQNYTFYNPRLHAEFTEEGSPHLFFEGTYTILFAGASKGKGLVQNYPLATPRYEYNQILYRLDLDEDALKPAYVPDRD